MGKERVMEVIKDYWDKKSEAFDIDREEEELIRWENVLIGLIGEDRNKSIVDIGTGTGFLANLTGRSGYPTIGIDISGEMLKYAVKRGEECGSSAIYMEGTAMVLPFADSSVDYIVNARLIWTLTEVENVLKEWNRVIRPGGGCLCFNTMKEGVGITVKERKKEFYQDEEADSSLEISGASMDELKELMNKSGFSDVEIRKLPELGKVGKDNLKGEICDYESWYVIIGRK